MRKQRVNPLLGLALFLFLLVLCPFCVHGFCWSVSPVFSTYREAIAEQKLLEARVEEIKRGLQSAAPVDHNHYLQVGFIENQPFGNSE